MEALLLLDSWAGRTNHFVRVLKETPKRYFIEFLDGDCFHGKFQKGKTYYVPKHAIVFIKNIHITGNENEQEKIS